MNRALSFLLVMIGLSGVRVHSINEKALGWLHRVESEVMLFNLRVITRQAQFESKTDPSFKIGEAKKFIRSVMQREEGKDPSKDFWGTDIQLSQNGLNLLVTSAGPDKVFETGDDIIASAALNRL